MLNQDVERYATLQRTLGYKFGDQSRSLMLFANYAMARGDEFVRIDRVLAWVAVQTLSAQRRQILVGRVRQFALAMHAENPRHEVPPRDCVGHAKIARRAPYIYPADEIDHIMRTAGQMPAEGFIAPATLTALLGLLAATGLRISEALSLQVSDVGDDGLVIRKSKFGKSRLVPMHETTQAALGRYLSIRACRPVYTGCVRVEDRSSAHVSCCPGSVPAVAEACRSKAGIRKQSWPTHA